MPTPIKNGSSKCLQKCSRQAVLGCSRAMYGSKDIPLRCLALIGHPVLSCQLQTRAKAACREEPDWQCSSTAEMPIEIHIPGCHGECWLRCPGTLPDMTRWSTEESTRCISTWSQDRIHSWTHPFGKSEDSCKPPQGDGPPLCLVPSPGPERCKSRPSSPPLVSNILGADKMP